MHFAVQASANNGFNNLGFILSFPHTVQRLYFPRLRLCFRVYICILCIYVFAKHIQVYIGLAFCVYMGVYFLQPFPCWLTRSFTTSNSAVCMSLLTMRFSQGQIPKSTIKFLTDNIILVLKMDVSKYNPLIQCMKISISPQHCQPSIFSN